jgi:arylsulfatase A-like enzyme
VARLGLRAGYRPVLFGYTDQGADLRRITDPEDPRLTNWEGVLPGFEELLCLDERHAPWLEWLRSMGYDATDPDVALATEHERPAEHSVTQFLTDRFLGWLDEQSGPWFAHTSYLRPHPPYDAAGDFSTMYDPADCPPPLPVPDDRHGVLDLLLKIHWTAGPTEPDAMAQLQAQYFGMITEVDHHMGRIWQALKDRGDWENTVIIVTADHGEQLCDQGLIQKAGFYESSYHIPALVRDPQHPEGFGLVIDDFTENVDIMPTLCEAIDAPVPLQCDGLPLTPFLRGERPRRWRTAAHYEWDWRDARITMEHHEWPWDRRLEQSNLAVLRTDSHAYVQFGDGDWLCFDLAADPTWQTKVTDPAVVLPLAQAMLTWRQTNLDRQLTGTLIRHSGVAGRTPDTLPA